MNGTFSVYKNFVLSDENGSPKNYSKINCLKHLELLIENSSKINNKLIIIGFSKGCVVLN